MAVLLIGTLDTKGAEIGHVRDRHRPAAGGPMGVEHLAGCDPEQPSAQVPVVPQARIGPQGGQHRLLPAVVGVDRPNTSGQVAVDVGTVLVEEHLERWQLHVRETPRKARA